MPAYITDTTTLHTCKIDTVGNITIFSDIVMTPARLKKALESISSEAFPARLLPSLSCLREVLAVAKIREANYKAVVGK